VSAVSPLPMRDGVSASRVWLPNGPWKTIGEYFLIRFPQVAMDSWQRRVNRGELLDDRGDKLTLEHDYRCGACVYYYRERAIETLIPLQETILYQDDELLVVDKPHFLPVTPGGRFLQETLLVRLKRSTGIESLSPIHRLDRETAGVMMLSVNPQTRSLWQSLFRNKLVTKQYLAIAAHSKGQVFPISRQSRLERDDQFFRMKEVDGPSNTHTRIEFIEQRGDHALYALIPVTGKMHQLRVHMNAIGLPILNDSFYPVALPAESDDFSKPLKLLAKSISFNDPVTVEPRLFTSLQNL
jgi:tRNA pseudouridine32 synthase/23S rRNA pseudouridine746 synthase